MRYSPTVAMFALHFLEGDVRTPDQAMVTAEVLERSLLRFDGLGCPESIDEVMIRAVAILLRDECRVLSNAARKVPGSQWAATTSHVVCVLQEQLGCIEKALWGQKPSIRGARVAFSRACRNALVRKHLDDLRSHTGRGRWWRRAGSASARIDELLRIKIRPERYDLFVERGLES